MASGPRAAAVAYQGRAIWVHVAKAELSGSVRECSMQDISGLFSFAVAGGNPALILAGSCTGSQRRPPLHMQPRQARKAKARAHT